MLLVFQIILFIIIIISFMGIFGEQEKVHIANQLTSLCIAAIITLGVTFFL